MKFVAKIEEEEEKYVICPGQRFICVPKTRSPQVYNDTYLLAETYGLNGNLIYWLVNLQTGKSYYPFGHSLGYLARLMSDGLEGEWKIL